MLATERPRTKVRVKPKTTPKKAVAGPPVPAHIKARNQYFPKDPIKGLARSEDRAVKSLAALHASNPAKYEARTKRGSRGWANNAVRDVAGAGEKGLQKAASAGKKLMDLSKTDSQRALERSGLAPDSSKLGKEALDIIANTPTGVYLAGASVVEAAQGRPQRAKSLYKDLKKTSALAPAVEAVGRNLRGKGAAKQWREAGHRANERPLTSALELSGVKAVIGRSTGAAMRAAPSKTTRRLASTDRANLRLYQKHEAGPGEGPEVARRYSKDVINKAAQVALERRAAKGSRTRKDGTQRRPARDPNIARGSTLVPSVPGHSGGAADGKPYRYALNRRLDTREFQKNQVVAEDVSKNVEKVLKVKRSTKTRQQGPLVQLVAEGALKTTATKHDIGVELGRLAKARKSGELKGERLRQNLAQATELRRLRDLPEPDVARSVAAAKDVGKVQHGIQERGGKAGVYDQRAQAKRHMVSVQKRVVRPASEARVKGIADPVDAAKAAQKIRQRAEKGKPLGPKMRVAAQNAERIAERAKVLPGQSMASAVANVALHNTKPPVKTGPKRKPDQRTVESEFKRHGGTLPIVIRPFRDPKHLKKTRGGYAGIKTDPATGKKYHLIYFNPTHGDGAISGAVHHEMGRALYTEKTGEFRPTTKLSDEDYIATPSYQSAAQHAQRNSDVDLTASPEELAPAVKAPTTDKGRAFIGRRGAAAYEQELQAAIDAVPRRVRVARRPLTPEEVAGQEGVRVFPRRGEKTRGTGLRPIPEGQRGVVDVLQRRSRRGKAGLSGTIEGGPALITHRPIGRSGAFSARGIMPRRPTRKRAGTAFTEGSRQVGWDQIVRQTQESTRAVGLAENAKLIDAEFGIPAGAKGRYARSADEALERGQARTHDPKTGDLRPGAEPLVPVEISRGRWLNFPESVVHNLEQHKLARSPHDLAPLKPVEYMSNAWKNVVLTTAHPSQWLASNAADLGMRGAMAGITPLDVLRGHKAMKTAEATGLQGRQAVQAVARGGLYHTGSSGARDGIRPVLGEGTLRDTGSVLGTPYRAWKKGVFTIERAIEAMPQLGAQGKIMRQSTGRTYLAPSREPRATREHDFVVKRNLKSMLKLHDQQVQAFGKELGTNRALEAHAQRYTEDIVGRWGKVSPGMRKTLGLAPFAQWLGAASRYVLMTLPAHHPIKTSILAGISEMTADERERMGLSYLLPRDKQAADYQMGALPFKVGKDKYGQTEVKGPQIGRMLSFGTAGQGIAGNVGGFLLPQVSGPLNAAAGTHFTGEQLVYPQDWPIASERGLPLSPNDRSKVALGLLIESVVPFGSALRTIGLEKGRPSDPTSSVLTPHTRPKYNKEADAWQQQPADISAGITKWLRPIPKPTAKVYPLGVGRDIQDAGATRRTLKKWQERAKAEKAKDPYKMGTPVKTKKNKPPVDIFKMP